MRNFFSTLPVTNPQTAEKALQPRLSRSTNIKPFSPKNHVTYEQITAVKAALRELEALIYDSELNYYSIADVASSVEIVSPGVGQPMPSISLPTVMTTTELHLPRRASEEINIDRWNTTRKKLSEFNPNKQLLIASGTCYILHHPKTNIHSLTVPHEVFAGPHLITDAFVANTSKGERLYYRILGGRIISQALYKEFLVRVPKVIQAAMARLTDHGYQMPTLLQDEMLSVGILQPAKTDVLQYDLSEESNLSPIAAD